MEEKQNNDEHIVKEEIYDADIMETILKDVNVSAMDKNKLRLYKKHKNGYNKVEIVYYYGKGCETNKLGRLFVKHNSGLQSFQHDIRNALLEKNYWDLDFENMHFNLMAKIGNDWGIHVDNIKYYCENRNECLQQINPDRRIAKIIFLKIAYGGDIKLYNEYYEDYSIIEKETEFLKNIKKEADSLIDMCYTKNMNYKNLVKNKPNPKASLFALILQTEERKCLMALDNYIKSIGRRADILIHDGLEMRKEENETECPINILRGGEHEVFNKTGYKLKLVNKPLENIFEKEETKIIDDIYATEVFVKLLGNNVCKDGNDIYYFDEETGLWEKNEADNKIFFKLINKYKNELMFDVGKKIINYSGTTKAYNIKDRLSAYVKENKNIKNSDTSMGKLLFNDGIYDFATDTFSKEFNPNIIFTKKINRNFLNKRDENLIKEVEKVLFKDAFDDGKDGLSTGIYLKKILCIALFGDYYRRKFFIGVGDSACGKSVLINAFQEAFDGYIDSFMPNNLQYNSLNGQDEAKQLSWIDDLKGVRIAFGSECRITDEIKPLDGNLIKSLSSGGDTLKIRKNHKEQFNFVNKATMFQLCNDSPNISPMDNAICERVKYIRYNLRFVNNPTKENERLGNPMIKFNFKTDDYKDALFYVMVDTYKNMTNSEKMINGEIEEPISVKMEIKEWLMDEKELFLAKLSKKYEITNNMNDYIETNELIDYFTNTCKFRMSGNKIGRNINKLIELEKKDITINNIKHKIGIKRSKEK